MCVVLGIHLGNNLYVVVMGFYKEPSIFSSFVFLYLYYFNYVCCLLFYLLCICIFIIYINKIVDDSTHKFRIFRFGTVEYIFSCNHLNLLDFKFNICVWCKKK